MKTQGKHVTKVTANEVDLGSLGYDPSNPETTEMQIPVEKVREKPVLKSTATESLRQVLTKFRGKHVKYGNSKEDFSRFVSSNKKSLVLILCIVLVVLAMVTFLVWFLNHDNQYKIEGTAVQYYAGQTYTLEDGAKLVRGLDDETVLSMSTGDTTLDALLIYQDAIQTVILPQDMAYYAPQSGTKLRIDALSELNFSSPSVQVTTGNQTTAIGEGFLYDGDDYYVFLEPVTISYNGYSMHLSAMSYVEAVYENYLVIFDYDTKECVVQEITSEITVIPDTGDYTLYLINDLLEYSTGDKTLLVSRTDVLDSVFD